MVLVDVRPRSDANKINPNSTNNINVAIFSGNGFDATKVDPNTVHFGATGTEAAPIHVARRDDDGDGDRDMVFRFQILDTGIKCGDTSAVLTGQFLAGRRSRVRVQLQQYSARNSDRYDRRIEKRMDELAREYHDTKRPGNPGRDF